MWERVDQISVDNGMQVASDLIELSHQGCCESSGCSDGKILEREGKPCRYWAANAVALEFRNGSQGVGFGGGCGTSMSTSSTTSEMERVRLPGCRLANAVLGLSDL
jgi:hypothetical protein